MLRFHFLPELLQLPLLLVFLFLQLHPIFKEKKKKKIKTQFTPYCHSVNITKTLR